MRLRPVQHRRRRRRDPAFSKATRPPARAASRRSTRCSRSIPRARDAATARLGEPVPLRIGDAARAAAPAQERLLRRPQLPRARRGRRARARRGAQAPGRADVLHQGADGDRRSRTRRCSSTAGVAEVRLGGRARRRDRHALQERARSGRARRHLRLHVPQRRQRARPAERDDAVVHGQDARRHVSARAVARRPPTRSATRSSSTCRCASTATSKQHASTSSMIFTVARIIAYALAGHDARARRHHRDRHARRRRLRAHAARVHARTAT